MTNAQSSLAKQLSAEIIQHQDDYYNGTPTISDPEYDAKEARLRAIDPNDPALKYVGKTKSTGPRIKHARPMLSIENYYTLETFSTAAKSYGEILLLEQKRDGISCEITYIDGKMHRAVTRGDGEAGEDMTAQVSACKKIPQTIKTKIHDLRVRGECAMRNSELQRLNALGGKQHSNTRNLTAGTMKQQDLSIVASREIVMIPWDVYSPDEDNLLPDSSYERMTMLESYGFPKYGGYLVKTSNMNDFWNTFNVLLKINEVSDITADGIVLKVDSHKLRNKLGVSSKYTNYQHCFKPQNLSSTTTLLGIEYGLGRTGKVTPVALLKPVNLGGAMVARASVCNEAYMEALDLSIGCEVEILRSGDVIPYIVKVTKKGTKKIVFPTHCPSCNTKLVFNSEKEIEKECPNSFCAGKAAKQFAYVGNRETLEIDNLGESMSEELVSNGVVTIADLFEFSNGGSILHHSQPTVSLLGTKFRSGVNAMKMVKSLETAKTANWDRWIASLNIPNIGHSLGEDIAKTLKLGSEDMKNFPKLLLTLPALNLPKLGKVLTAGIIVWAKNKDNVLLCERLYNAGVRPTGLAVKKVAAGAKLAGVVVCMTGELSMGTRKEVGVKLEALGAEIVDDVKSNCNLVIVGDKPGSKLAKAQKKGIKIVDDAWVRKTLGL